MSGETTASAIGARIGMKSRHVRGKLLVLCERGLAEFVCEQQTESGRVAHFYKAKPFDSAAQTSRMPMGDVQRYINAMARVGQEEAC